MEPSFPDPAQEIRQQVDDLRFKLDNLQDNASLKSTIDEFTDYDSKSANLLLRIQSLRQRKYAFDKLLENKATDISNRWTLQRAAIEAQISLQANSLRSSLQSLEIRFNSMSSLPSSASIQMLQDEADQFEQRCSSVGSSIQAMYDNLKQEIDDFNKQISELEYTMEKTETASFGFLPGEAVVKAVKAIWCKNGREEKTDPEGVLFQTDQRLIFEQNEEVTTKKVLFVATEKQKIQQMLFDVPAVAVDDVKSSKQGLFKNQDFLDLYLAQGNFAARATLHIFEQPSDEWQKLVLQVKSHEIDSNRVIAVDQAAVEKAKSAPTQCPACGGLITKPVLRGMDTITCEFCGKIIRL